MENVTLVNKDFDNILIIPFLRAIEAGSGKSIGVDKITFEALAKEYVKEDKKADSPLEKRVKKYTDKKFIVTATLFVLTKEIADEEMMQVLRDQGYKIERDTYFEDITQIAQSIEFLDMRIAETKEKIPVPPKKNKKGNEKFNIFDILTSVSTGLELSLDFSKMVVSEFLSYRGALSRKIAKMEEQTKKIKAKK